MKKVSSGMAGLSDISLARKKRKERREAVEALTVIASDRTDTLCIIYLQGNFGRKKSKWDPPL